MFRSPPHTHCNTNNSSTGSPYAQQRPNNPHDTCPTGFRPGSPRFHSSPRPNRFHSPNNASHFHATGHSHIYGPRPTGNMYPPQNQGRSPRGYTPRSTDHNRSWHERSRGGHSPYHNNTSYGQV